MATRIIGRGSAQPETKQINEINSRQGSGSVRKRPTSVTSPSSAPTNRRPNVITAAGDQLKSSLSAREVVVKDSYRQDTSVVIQWESETSNILGFRVVYRLFGDDSFQPGPPLDPSAREFIIKNVPHQVPHHHHLFTSPSSVYSVFTDWCCTTDLKSVWKFHSVKLKKSSCINRTITDTTYNIELSYTIIG